MQQSASAEYRISCEPKKSNGGSKGAREAGGAKREHDPQRLHAEDGLSRGNQTFKDSAKDSSS